MKEKHAPKTKPLTTSLRECCLSIIRLVPTIPANMMTRQSHHTGLKANISEKAISPPVTPPMAAMCVDIFMNIFVTAHAICTTRAAIRMLPMKRGTCHNVIR